MGTKHALGSQAQVIEAAATDGPVTIHGSADNDDAAPASDGVASFEALRQKHGAPTPIALRVAFMGYDPAAGLALGRRVATERIVKSVPGIVVTTHESCSKLSAERRARLVGYHHGFLAVLLAETAALAELSVRYDRVARVGAVSRAQCEALAKDALRNGRECRDAAVRVVKRFVPAGSALHDTLTVSAEGIETAEQVATGVEALSTWITRWLASMSPEERAFFEQMGFHGALVDELDKGAAGMRRAQADLDALSDPNRVTQRQLDEQDGRVLHLVGTLWVAFSTAHRTDAGIVLPSLGELTPIFDRRRSDAAPDEPVPPAPTPT